MRAKQSEIVVDNITETCDSETVEEVALAPQMAQSEIQLTPSEDSRNEGAQAPPTPAGSIQGSQSTEEMLRAILMGQAEQKQALREASEKQERAAEVVAAKLDDTVRSQVDFRREMLEAQQAMDQRVTAQIQEQASQIQEQASRVQDISTQIQSHE